MRASEENNIELCNLLESNIIELIEQYDDKGSWFAGIFFYRIKFINDNFTVFFQQANGVKGLTLTPKDSAISSALQIPNQKLRGLERMSVQFGLAQKNRIISELEEKLLSGTVEFNKKSITNLINHLKKPSSKISMV